MFSWFILPVLLQNELGITSTGKEAYVADVTDSVIVQPIISRFLELRRSPWLLQLLTSWYFACLSLMAQETNTVSFSLWHSKSYEVVNTTWVVSCMAASETELHIICHIIKFSKQLAEHKESLFSSLYILLYVYSQRGIYDISLISGHQDR